MGGGRNNMTPASPCWLLRRFSIFRSSLVLTGNLICSAEEKKFDLWVCLLRSLSSFFLFSFIQHQCLLYILPFTSVLSFLFCAYVCVCVRLKERMRARRYLAKDHVLPILFLFLGFFWSVLIKSRFFGSYRLQKLVSFWR